MIIGIMNPMNSGVVYEMTTKVKKTLRNMNRKVRKFEGTMLSSVSTSFENLLINRPVGVVSK